MTDKNTDERPDNTPGPTAGREPPPKKPVFGKLNRPEPRPSLLATAPSLKRKRSATIALVVLGGGAVAALAALPSSRCQSNNPNTTDQTCRSSSGGHGGGGAGGSRIGTGSSTSTASVQRGGFGKTGFSLFGHAGG